MPVAQLVEHLTFNQRAQDSSSCRRTRKVTIHRIIYACIVAFFFVFLSADYFLTTLLFTHIKSSPQPTGNTGRLGALLCLYYLPASTVCRRLARSDR